MLATPLDGRVDDLRVTAKAQTPEAAREVARQFEALFAQQLLSGLRSTAQVPGSGVQDLGPMQSMLDQQMGALLTHGKGLGLAEQLMQQWQQLGQVAAPVAGETRHVLSALGTGPARVMPAAPDPTTSWQSRARKFVEDLLPLAREAAGKLGVAPQAIIAQAALETGFGRHQPGGQSNNLFGIKAFASWRGAKVQAETIEVRAGHTQTESAAFRAYDSVRDSVGDYVALLSQPRYTAARNTGADVAGFARGLQQAGYATDPDYARKITDIAQRIVREGWVP
ncbi:flagellar assembly peptidoglycan hydrolase FlgJ [Polycyclovorans algicola]|uniref:flagellar assembly peptidoglycan hydrolase FlgJ n=1 Tax=Polycyclovorans algicola TaxID=616992 RepID=UPI0006944602|nr:flagellar assembly peptidoglycan hydrolase FlgJ [Polycyclovorans algicola]